MEEAGKAILTGIGLLSSHESLRAAHIPEGVSSMVGLDSTFVSGFSADCSLVSMSCQFLISMFDPRSSRVLLLKNSNSEYV